MSPGWTAVCRDAPITSPKPSPPTRWRPDQERPAERRLDEGRRRGGGYAGHLRCRQVCSPYWLRNYAHMFVMVREILRARYEVVSTPL